MPKQITIKFDFGDEVQDILTGLKGIVGGYTKYITGCDQFLVYPVSVDNKPSEAHWFDEIRLTLINAGVVKIEPEKKELVSAPGPGPAAPIR